MHHLLLVIVAFTPLLAARPLQSHAVDDSRLSREEREAFLSTADIIEVREIGTGVTLPQRATLASEALTHDAQIQCVDIFRQQFRSNRRTEFNFRDTYKFNIAAYRLDKLLNLQMIPVSVERRVSGTSCAVTWWVDDVILDEKTRRDEDHRAPDPRAWTYQMGIVHVFDQLIDNTDRNTQNLLIDREWKLWMIDHTRAFRRFKELRNPSILQWCDRVLLERLRSLDEDVLRAALGRYLDRWEIEGLAARAQLIVEHFDERIAERGEGAVLYTWLPP